MVNEAHEPVVNDDDDAQLEVEPDEFPDRVPNDNDDRDVDDVDNDSTVPDDNHEGERNALLADNNFDTEDANGSAEGDEAEQAHRDSPPKGSLPSVH